MPLIVAFAMIPMIGIVGLTTDYSIELSVKAKLDHAADAAVIAGIATAQTYVMNYTGTGDPTASAVAAGQAQATAQFNANTGTLPNGGSLSVTTPQITETGQMLTGSISYTYSMPTVFMKALGKASMSFSGSAQSTLTMPGYTNIYVVIDVSSSMGIGATASDQQTVYNATKNQPSGQCAVACHYDGSEVAAHAAGATLRIDVAKTALKSALNQIINSPNKNQYQVAIYTLSNGLTKVFALSGNLTSAVAAVDTIDLANDNNDGGTDITGALNGLKSQLPTPGNGRTQAAAKGTIMLITDGVQDSDMKYLSLGQYKDKSDPNFTLYSPGQYFSTFGIWVEAFDPTQCATLKALNFQVLTLNVQYIVPDPSYRGGNVYLDQVFTYIQQNLASSIPAQMSICASSSANAYVANTPAQITAAVQAMFASVANLARLTQ